VRFTVNSGGEVIREDDELFGGPDHGPESERDRDYRIRTRKALGEFLDPEAAEDVELIWRAQEAFTDGRFRIGHYDGGTWLSTEFCAPQEDKPLWARLYHAAAVANAVIEHVSDWPDDVPPERQVEIKVRLTSLRLPYIAVERERLRRETEQLWADAGVCVI
jgi:hypothetical protein